MARSCPAGIACWTLLLLLNLAGALQPTPQQEWYTPLSPDDTTTVTNGQTMRISWNTDLWQWFQYYAPDADASKSDLWVCGWDQHQFEHLVATGVNVNGSNRVISWQVNIPSSELSKEQQWVFRFTKFGSDPLNSANVSSAAFMVQPVPAVVSSSSTSSTSTITHSTTPAGSSAVATATATTSVTTNPQATGAAKPESSSGLSHGAVAGIAIGAVIGGVATLTLLCAAVWYVARRTGKRKGQGSPPVYDCDDKSDHTSYPVVIVPPVKNAMVPVRQEVYQQGPNAYGYNSGTMPVSELEHTSRYHSPPPPQQPAELAGVNRN